MSGLGGEKLWTDNGEKEQVKNPSYLKTLNIPLKLDVSNLTVSSRTNTAQTSSTAVSFDFCKIEKVKIDHVV
jgi:hypothetical protein